MHRSRPVRFFTTWRVQHGPPWVNDGAIVRRVVGAKTAGISLAQNIVGCPQVDMSHKGAKSFAKVLDLPRLAGRIE